MRINNVVDQADKALTGLILGLFGCIVAAPLFSDGMFLDGVIYAAVSNNMALGIGHFWEPHLSNTLFDSFYEHPPLAMGLESLWFKLFGSSIYVERFYSLACFFINARIIVEIWRELTNDKSLSFLPLLFFILIPDIQWSFSNNLLENTMMIFCCLSFYFLIKHLKTARIAFLVLSGFLLYLSILSKGFVGLYLWGFPIFSWFFLRNSSFIRSIQNTFILLCSTLLPLLILYLFLPLGWESFISYIEEQVVNSLQNVQTVNSRFEIIYIFLYQIAIATSLSIVIWLFVRRKAAPPSQPEEKKYGYILLCLVAGGVLPILISLKQRGFYILTVYPFYSLAMALLLKPYIKFLVQKLRLKTVQNLKIGAYALGGLALVLSAIQFKKIGRDKSELELIYFIQENLPKGITIDLANEFKENWSLHAYAARHGQFNLIRSSPTQAEYKIENANQIERYAESDVLYQSDKYALVKKETFNPN